MTALFSLCGGVANEWNANERSHKKSAQWSAWSSAPVQTYSNKLNLVDQLSGSLFVWVSGKNRTPTVRSCSECFTI